MTTLDSRIRNAPASIHPTKEESDVAEHSRYHAAQIKLL